MVTSGAGGGGIDRILRPVQQSVGGADTAPDQIPDRGLGTNTRDGLRQTGPTPTEVAGLPGPGQAMRTCPVPTHVQAGGLFRIRGAASHLDLEPRRARQADRAEVDELDGRSAWTKELAYGGICRTRSSPCSPTPGLGNAMQAAASPTHSRATGCWRLHGTARVFSALGPAIHRMLKCTRTQRGRLVLLEALPAACSQT